MFVEIALPLLLYAVLRLGCRISCPGGYQVVESVEWEGVHAGDDIGQVGYQPLLVFLAEGGPQVGEFFAAQLRHDQIGPAFEVAVGFGPCGPQWYFCPLTMSNSTSGGCCEESRIVVR